MCLRERGHQQRQQCNAQNDAEQGDEEPFGREQQKDVAGSVGAPTERRMASSRHRSPRLERTTATSPARPTVTTIAETASRVRSANPAICQS